MTAPKVAELLERAKALSPQERDELIRELALMQSTTALEGDESTHWGQALNQLLDEIGPIEMKYPEIEDPVEWVKHLRAEQHRRRLGNWDNAE